MTFYDSELCRVLEEVLPASFGGGPLDYQLVEEEARTGTPVLSLVVDPAVGPLHQDRVIETFLDAIGGGQELKRVMVEAWRDGRYVRLVRRRVAMGRSGKIQHLHSERRAPVAGAR
jgi:hypothetical protein